MVYFEQALQDIAFASEGLYEAATASIPSSSQVSGQRLRELIADAFIEITLRSSEQVYGPITIRMAEHWLHFYEQSPEHIATKVTKLLTNAIQDALDRSKLKRVGGSTMDNLRRRCGWSKVVPIIY